jgi:RNA polymerase sigma-70 factor (ECF subfamily)
MIPFDKAFVKRCKKGDRAAQKQLFEKLYGPMYRVCFRYLSRQAEAEDCLMKGFMKAFQHLEKFEYKDEYSLYSWVKKVMVNESLMDLRKVSLLSLAPSETLPDSAVYDDILEQLAAEEIYTLITELPAGYRTVFNLFVIEGHTHLEIAEMLNINESTSRSQLVKARNMLKARIEKNNVVYETKQG